MDVQQPRSGTTNETNESETGTTSTTSTTTVDVPDAPVPAPARRKKRRGTKTARRRTRPRKLVRKRPTRPANYNSKIAMQVLQCPRCEGTGKVPRPVVLPADVTMEQLAQLTGKSKAMVSRIFSADDTQARWRGTIREIVQMAGRLGMTVDEFVATVLG